MKDNPHLNILVQLAKIDGETDIAELELIREIGASNNVSDEDIEAIIENTATEDAILSLASLDHKSKVELMTNLVLMMKVDGRIHKEEMKFCLKVIRKLGYDENDLFELVSTTYTKPSSQNDMEAIRKQAKDYLNGRN